MIFYSLADVTQMRELIAMWRGLGFTGDVDFGWFSACFML